MRNDQLVAAVAAQLERDVPSNGNGTQQPSGQVPFWPEPLTYKTFKSRPIDPTRWLWANALPINSTSLLVGKPRDGKTTLALNLALAISRGSDFLGRPTVKSSGLYVSIDNSADEMAQISDDLQFQDEDQVRLHTGQLPLEATDWLVEMIKKFSIIDIHKI